MSNMDKKGFKTLLAWFLLNTLLMVNGIDVTPPNPKKFDTVIFSANASGQTSLTWEKDTKTLTTCFVGISFCSNLNNIDDATVSINTLESILTINSINQTSHGGHYEATGSTPVDVLVNTLPVTVNWTAQPQGNLTAASAEWTARIYCVFPTSEINVDFTVYVEGVKEVSPRSPIVTTETDSNCDSPEQTVVAKLSLLSSKFLNQKVYIIANASHASFPTEPSVTSGQSAEAIFQGVYTSTPTSITKPPPDNTCFLGIPDIEDIHCGIILAVVIIVILTIAFVCFKLLRRNICKKQQSDKYKNHDTRNDGAAQAESTAKKTHENSAKRRDDNPSVSKPNNEESKDSATDERVNQSRKSMDDMSQHENVLNDATNIGVKNGKKEGGTNKKDDNASIYTPNYRESQSSANGKRDNKSPESTFIDRLKQNESLSNSAKNIGVKDDKNGLKSEDINLETIF